MALQTGVSIRGISDLGTVSGTRTINDSVTSTFYSDFYRFSMDKGGITARLSSLSSDANIRLVRDTNSNSVIDAGDEITRSAKVGTADEYFTIDGLGQGTYIMEVNLQGSTGSTNYKLDLTTRPGIVDYESESNNTISTPDYIDGNGKINLNGTRHMRGAVTSGTDAVDVYQFKVDTPSTFSASLTGLSSGATYDLLNSNGQLIYSASANGDIAGVYGGSEHLDAGKYFVRVNKSGSGSTSYNLDVSANPISRGRVHVKLEQVKALSSFDPIGAADFYAKVGINGDVATTDSIDGNNNPTFNFTMSRDVSASSRFIPITLAIYDDDFASADGHADINPIAGVQDLSLIYDSMTNKVFTSNGVYLGGENGLITLQGNGDSDRAAVSFRINYDPIV